MERALLGSILAGHHQAGELLDIPEQVGQLTLEASNEGGKRLYLAHGKADFFGDEAVARTDGAGGQNRTGYARLFRAALYQ